MTKIRKKIVGIVLCLTMLLVGVCMLTACGSKDDATVTFMVQNETGAWEQYYSAEVKDGKVTLPAAPTKTNYVFRDWYDYSASPEAFRNDGIEDSKTVYAYFVPAEVKISLNGADGDLTKLADLDALTWEYTATALKSDLSFDGWYTDENYAVKYEEGMDVTELYARFLAHVTFDNGYQTLYEANVPLGNKLTAPEAVVETTEAGDVTFEDKYVVKDYMDADTISYLADGNEVDFTQAVAGNMDITVRWQTPYLDFERDSDSGNYTLRTVDGNSHPEVKDYPVVSVLSFNTVVDKSGSGDNVTLTRGTVTGVYYDMLGATFAGAKKFMFEEGIEWIANFNGNEATAVEEVSLPSSLKVLESSLNCMPRLKGVTLPAKLVAVLDCFWADYAAVGNYRYPLSEKTYDFTVAIPDSVSNVVRLPGNVAFGKNSAFSRDENDGRIYKTEGSQKILVSEYQHNVTADGVLEIPSGVTGMQVGMLYGLKYNTLKLASTVKKPYYNASVSIVPGYYSATQGYGGRLYRTANIANPSGASAGQEWFSIEQKLGGGVDRVELDATSVPSGFKSFSFIATDDFYSSTDYTSLSGYPVVCTKTIAEGSAVTVNIHGSSKTDANFNKKYTNKKILKSGEKLTKTMIAEALGLQNLGYEYKITELTELGEAFDENTVVTRNLYLTLKLEYAKSGVTFELNDDETAYKVAGFDQANAQIIDEANGLYLVNIPEEYNGKPVTEIAEGAFANVESVSKIYISKSVKTIGAYAFENTNNLALVDIAPGGLETIKGYAFTGAGCYELDGKYVKDSDIQVRLPLATVKSIEPYAFKTPAITEFLSAEGEEERSLFGYPSSEHYVNPDVKAGDYFFVRGGYGYNYGIIRYVSNEAVKKNDEKGEVTVNVYDVQYVATAGGYNKAGSEQLALGYSYRNWANYFPVVNNYVMRYEVMEGSVYHLFYHTQAADGNTDRSFNYITIGIVSKIHTNAFTDMGMDASLITYYSQPYDSWIGKDQITSQDPAIFENGWWQNVSNESMKESLANIKAASESTLS